METVRKPLNEDRVALLLGSVIFILALLKFSGIDMLGWAVKIGMWVGDPLDAWRPATKGLLPGYGALFATYAILTGALACCVKLMGNDVVKFVKSFTIIFFIAMICYTLGANAYIAANPTQLKAQGIPWALGLSTEAGLILALVMGIVISNFMPNLAESLKDACRPELFVKIAIVIMGAELGVKAADAADLNRLADELADYDVVTAAEVGGGVVPIDPAARAAREAAGRLACLLAARADCVVQMFCGLPTILKGELPKC